MCELLEERIKEERAEAIEQTRADNAREIAKSLLMLGELSIEKIAKCCNLTVNEVLALNNPA